MKLAHVFKLTILCFSIASAAFASEESLSLDVLKEKIFDIENAIKSIHKSAEHDEISVLAFGASGSGKSTLLTALMKRVLVAEDSPESRVLTAFTPLTGINITHGGAVGTRLPVICVDDSTGTRYVDCCGSDDPRGGVDEIVNAYALIKLMNSDSPIKVIFVAGESAFLREGHFLRSLKQLTDMFENLDELKACLCIVITKQERVNPATIFGSFLAINNKDNAYLADPLVREMLEFLIKNQETRVGILPYPKEIGAYDMAHGERLVALVAGVEGVINPKVHLSLSYTALQAVDVFLKILNEEIKIQLSEVISSALMNHVWLLITEQAKPARERKKDIERVMNDLLSLPSDSHETFFAELERILEFLGMDKTILTKAKSESDSIKYLESLNPAVFSQIGSSHSCLTPITSMLRILTLAPEVVSHRHGETIRTYSEDYSADRRMILGIVGAHSTINFAEKAIEEQITTFFDLDGTTHTAVDPWHKTSKTVAIKL